MSSSDSLPVPLCVNYFIVMINSCLCFRVFINFRSCCFYEISVKPRERLTAKILVQMTMNLQMWSRWRWHCGCSVPHMILQYFSFVKRIKYFIISHSFHRPLAVYGVLTLPVFHVLLQVAHGRFPEKDEKK